MRPARHAACASSHAAGQARRAGRRRGSADCGWVTLTGRVTREYEKERAEEDALRCSGVAGVSNRVICEARN